MPKDSVLLDTNLLIYLYLKKSPKARVVKDLIYSLREKDTILVLAEQSLLEFYSVVTDPKRVKKPVSSQRAQKEITKFSQSGFFKIIQPLPGTFKILLKIINDKKIRGGRIFDFYLAATTLSNKVTTIYTENEKDFKGIKSLKVISPF